MPTNLSFAHLSKFRIIFPFMSFLSTGTTFEQGKSMTLNCSHINLPDLSITQTEIPTSFYTMKTTNRDMKWGNLNAIYSVDELYTNFKFMYDWFMYMHDPETYIVNNTDAMVDATLMIYSNNNNPKLQFTLKNVFPIGLGGLEYSKESVDNEDIKHAVSFSVDYYKLEIL